MKPLALLLFLATMFSGCTDYYPPRSEVTPDMLKGEEYVGLIRNCTDRPISVPSENSGATLIVPAHSFIAYTAWTKDFTLEGYLDVKKVFCKKIFASPKQFTYMCKQYDFMAEIGVSPNYLGVIAPSSVCPPEPVCPPEEKSIKKKRRVKECTG
jgi:hypothetical protein